MAPRSLLGYAIPYVAVVGGLTLLGSAWGAMLAYQAGMVALLLRDHGRLPLRPRARPERLEAGVGLLGALAGPALALVWPLLAPGAGFRQELGAVGLSGGSLLAFLAVFSTLNVVLEEAFWRGRPPRDPRPDLSDFLFAGYHAIVLARFLTLPGTALALAALVFAAWVWRRAAIRAGSLAPAVLSHAAAAIGISIVIWMQAGR